MPEDILNKLSAIRNINEFNKEFMPDEYVGKYIHN